VPVIGGDTFGGVQALISDKAAAAEASTPQYCITYIGCTPSLSVLAAFNYSDAHITVDIDGGNINDYATVPQASAGSAAVSNRRIVHVPGGKQLASFTIHSSRGTPNVQLTSPARCASPPPAYAGKFQEAAQPHRCARLGRHSAPIPRASSFSSRAAAAGP